MIDFNNPETVEQIKAAGFIPKTDIDAAYIPKTEFEGTISKYQSSIKAKDDEHFKKVGHLVDNAKNKITELTGVKPNDFEKESGLWEREKLEDYIPRALAEAKKTGVDPEKIKLEMSRNFQAEIENTKKAAQTWQSKYADQVMNAATAKVFAGQEKEDFERNSDLIKGLFAQKYKQDFDDNGNIVFKNTSGDVVTSSKDGITPLSAIELMQGLAESYKLTQKAAPAGGAGTSSGNKKSNSGIASKSDAISYLEAQGLIKGSKEFTEKYDKMVADGNLQ